MEADVELVNRFDDLHEGMRSIGYREIQKEAWVKWLVDLRPWMAMITLTYGDKKCLYPISADCANKDYRDLVRKMNVGVFGPHYTKKCHHSYFGYALGTEYQKRDVIHFHFLVDNYVCFDLIHRYWGNKHGFAWTDIVDDRSKVVDYVTKYLLKAGGNIEIYIPHKKTVPMFKPVWWQEAESRAAGAFPAACEALDAASIKVPLIR